VLDDGTRRDPESRLRHALPARPRGGTYGGKLNRTSLMRCVMMMQRLLPALLLVWIDVSVKESPAPARQE